MAHCFRLMVCVGLLVGMLAGRSMAEQTRPNIIFFFSDDHATSTIGAYGGFLSKHAQTPNLDRLANEGMLFERCLVTNSICGPMRAVVLTGKYSHLNGRLRNSGGAFNVKQQSFPSLMQDAGYQTALIGKWHLGTGAAPRGFNYSSVLVRQGPYYNPVMLVDKHGTGDVEKREKVTYEGYTTDIIADLSLEWLKNGRDKTKPFMLMSQQKAPHRNWMPGPKYLTLYDDVTLPEPTTLMPNHEKRSVAVQQNKMVIAKSMSKYDLKLSNQRGQNASQKKVWDEAYGPKNKAYAQANDNFTAEETLQWKYQRYAKDYLRCIASVDDGVGRILDYLDETGLAKNTIVIYTSDQGFFLGEQGWFDKRYVYEPSLRTPLLVRWPGTIKAGSRNKNLVSPLDFAQTFLDIAGTKQPEDMQGRSLVPLLKGQKVDDWRTAHYYHYYEFPGAHSVRRHYAICTNRYKLIHYYEDDIAEKDKWELIDLKVDPEETTDFYNDPAYAETREVLKVRLKELQTELKVEKF